MKNLYAALFPIAKDRRVALGLTSPADLEAIADEGLDAFLNAVEIDDATVGAHRLEALRETLLLEYPSYILALAMGAGKTLLVGTIIVTEFALARECPKGSFMKNALVFAPGKTIFESLKELAQLPINDVLPPHLAKPVAANLKLVYTRDGDKDIPVIRGSEYNVVVTNTEKIRITKERIRKQDLGAQLLLGTDEEAREEVANLRLQTIASLPALGIFSDEAHHTYGQQLGNELKRVRQTVDYLHRNTDVLCVVNTTGTPYFERQPLRDVVVWYGLAQGIEDGILKEVGDNIVLYDFGDDRTADYLRDLITDFWSTYGETCLPSGALAKLAIYFPQNADLDELRPVVEQKVFELGGSTAEILRYSSKASEAERDAFNRLNDPTTPHRVILLVNAGTEGWNCPSLFACALARRLPQANNFVLQAATRCLRQVPGNTTPARIYLSRQNRRVLERQLEETYGESIADLEKTKTLRIVDRLILRKPMIDPIVLKTPRLVVHPEDRKAFAGPLVRPPVVARRLTKSSVAVEPGARMKLGSTGEEENVTVEEATLDARTAAALLAADSGEAVWSLLDELRAAYEEDDVLRDDIPLLLKQLDERGPTYVRKVIVQDRVYDIVRAGGFNFDEVEAFYWARISYDKGREARVVHRSDTLDQSDLSFHLDPYRFDSQPELDLLIDKLLKHLSLGSHQVTDVVFTGALRSADKTGFLFDYRDSGGRWRQYAPDFLIRRNDGRLLLIEVKMEGLQEDADNGITGTKATAINEIVKLNADRLEYRMIFTSGPTLTMAETKFARDFASATDE